MNGQNNNELYHYGVPGMKWGHRKSTTVMTARKNYKKARKEEVKAKFKRAFKKETYLAGYENRQKDKRNIKNVKSLSKKREAEAFKYIDKQAKYAYDKKLAKTGDKRKAENASMKVHAKAMAKNKYGSGLVGSIADAQKRAGSAGGNTRYYKHLAATKGKSYASKVEKKYSKKIVRNLVGGLAVSVGISLAPRVIEKINERR